MPHLEQRRYTMFKRSIFFLFVIASLFSVAVYAQDPARDVQDLVGARASSGESELRTRGYAFVKSTRGDDRIWSNWWNNRRNQCITVVTMDGRYDSIVTSPAFDCNRQAGGSGGGNENRVRPPAWARGTWYGRGPGGENITLVVNSDGAVTANVNGGMNYGSYLRNNYLRMNEALSRVTRQGSNIVTTRTDNGERIVYSKNEWSGGGGNWGGGGQVSPPTWARGTWYGRGPGGENITLVMNSNGSVTANINGSMNYGSYQRGNLLRMNEALSQVTRQGSNIVTTRTDNGERIVYSRSQWGGGGSGWGNSNKVNVDDLVGVRASSGESQMRARGFRNVDGFKSGNTSYTIWWRRQSSQCIQVATADGRYDSVKDIQTHPKCN